MDNENGHPARRTWPKLARWIVVLGGVLIVILIMVLTVFVLPSLSPDSLPGFKGTLFVQSLGIASLIGLFSTILGVPIARVLLVDSGRRRWVWPMALVPMWMPSYALYGAMNLARAPDTIVGQWLIQYATSEPSRRWAAVWAGYAIGIVGLSLWGSVIAAVAIVASKSRSESMYADMIALEPAGLVARGRLWIGIHRRGLAQAWGIVTAIMLGSSVPLHLAQFQTWSIVIWRELSERGPDQWGPVWMMGSPMVIVGLLGAWLVTRMVVKDATSQGLGSPGVAPVPSEGRTGGFGRLGCEWFWAVGVWVLAVVLPIVVLALSIDDWRALLLFWSERREALVHSMSIGFFVGLIALMVALLTAFALGHSSRVFRGLGVGLVFVSTASALLPGILVGAFFVQMLPSSGASEVLGLLTRTLVVATVVGAISAAREPGELLSVRWSMGATGLRAWWVAQGSVVMGPCLGAGILCALLAIHEVETSVMMTQAGVSTLSQSLLADLHYARLERLSAALLNIMGLAMVLSLVAGWLLNRSVNRRV